MPDPTPQEHRREALTLLAYAEAYPVGSERRTEALARAQVHATLAASGPSEDTLARAADLLRGAPPTGFVLGGETYREQRAKAAEIAEAEDRLDDALSGLTHPPVVRRRKSPARPKPVADTSLPPALPGLAE